MIKDGDDNTALCRTLRETYKAMKTNGREMTARYSIRITGLDRANIVYGFRCLEARGYGTYIIGRRGAETRFVWKMAQKDIDRFVSNDHKDSTIAPSEVKVEYDRNESDPEEVGLIEYKFKLRRDLHITLSLPDDLTDIEATRIGAFVATLPVPLA